MSIKFRSTLAGLILIISFCSPLKAQKYSISTDLLDYACLGTMNAEFSCALSRHWSLVAGAKYNPFTFRKNDSTDQFQLRQQSYALGVRFWPWYIWSGWLFAAKARWQEYNQGGIISRKTVEGDRLGGGIYAGYSYMLAPHLNLEFGLGVWTGADFYKVYSCQKCGLTVEQGQRLFVLPDDIMISLAYVF